MAQLKVTQIKSTIGTKRNQRESLRSLGLKRIHHTVLVEDNAVVRGYIKTAPHLLSVEEVEEAAGEAADNVTEGK
jgi:large subunit ribosomal protein L30